LTCRIANRKKEATYGEEKSGGLACGCGPGNLHLINGLYDAHRSRVPVLAIGRRFQAVKSAADIFRKPSRNISSRSAAII
jgi:hypothetical protein